MSILIILQQISNPRFTTQEMEKSQIRCGFDFEITSMYYDDERKNHPSHAFGWVKTPAGKPILAKWNRHGECFIESVRISSFDLVRPAQDEIVGANTINKSLVVGLIAIVICIIF